MKTLVSTLSLLCLLSLSAHAQQPIQLRMGDVDIRKMEVEVQKTPLFEAAGIKSKNIPNPRDWLELEVEFEVKGSSGTVIPELLFRYYIGFRDQSGQARTLTGDVKHVNVLMGERSYSAVYVSPQTLGEITGDFRRFQKSGIEAIGLEVYYNGVIVGGDSTRGGKFWEATGTSQGVLGKHQTPFALLWLDRYSDVDVSGR